MKQEAAAVYVRPDELKPWSRNPRKGKPVAEVAESIRRFGFATPIVARLDGTVIAGHTRLEAAQQLGLDRVPVRFVDLDEQEAAALALADNRLSELAEWDDDGLTAILSELEAASVPIDGLGWDAEALRDLLGSGEPTTEPTDDAPAVDDRVVHSRLGEVYELGPHRLVCGDSTQAGTWAALLGAERPCCVVTDPPYGMSYRGRTFGREGLSNDGDLEWEPVLSDTVGHVLNRCDNLIASVCFGTSRLDRFFRVMSGLSFDRMLTIYKPNRMAYPWRGWILTSETISLFHTGTPEWPESVNHVHDVYTFDYSERPGADVDHPTVKPLSIIRDLVAKTSAPASLVVDPFGGSGTTLLAAASLGRVARLIELDPRYCDVIRRRWTRWARENNQDPGPGALDDEVADAGADR